MPEIVSIISTHQARIRCLIANLIDGSVHRFQNGAVLKYTVSKDEISVELVYSGELDENKPTRKYYVTNANIDAGGKYTPVVFPTIIKFKNVIYNNVGEWTYVFYLIRHGQGEHNILKGFKKTLSSATGVKDTSLTEKGIDQARNTGLFFSTNTHFFKTTFLFASDLQRTRQTLVNVINAAEIGGKRLHTSEIVILPCAHELNYEKSGDCDGSRGQMFTANENKSICRDITDITTCPNNLNTYNIDWSFYNDFYNGTRSMSGPNKKRCRDTTILESAISIIKTILDTDNYRLKKVFQMANDEYIKNTCTCDDCIKNKKMLCDCSNCVGYKNSTLSKTNEGRYEETTRDRIFSRNVQAPVGVVRVAGGKKYTKRKRNKRNTLRKNIRSRRRHTKRR